MHESIPYYCSCLRYRNLDCMDSPQPQTRMQDSHQMTELGTRLEWAVGLYIRIKLRFQIYPAADMCFFQNSKLVCVFHERKRRVTVWLESKASYVVSIRNTNVNHVRKTHKEKSRRNFILTDCIILYHIFLSQEPHHPKPNNSYEELSLTSVYRL